MAVRKTDEEKEQIIQAYLSSGLNITDYCKLESSGTTGVSTLLTWLEQKGYRMTLVNKEVNTELETKYKKLFSSYTKLLHKHESEKFEEFVLSTIDWLIPKPVV